MNTAEQFGTTTSRAESPETEAEEREPAERAPENDFENEPREEGDDEGGQEPVEAQSEGREEGGAVLRILKEIAELSPREQRQIREVLTSSGTDRTQEVVEEERAAALRAVRERLTERAT